MFDQTQMQQPYMPMGGYQYQGYQNVPKIMNVLSDDEIKELQQQRSQFSLGLTARESLQAACNHRAPGGASDSLVYDPETGIARCTICGYEFRPIEPDSSYETIKDAADRIVDILQTIKLMYQDLPPQAAREYFQIIPLIGKIPQLFEFATKDFNKHEFNMWSYNGANMGGINMLNNLGAMLGAAPMGMPMGQPQMQQPYQAPMGMPMGQPMQQPYPQMGVGAPMPMAQPQQMPGANPFGFDGASQYVPQAQGYVYNPAQAPQQVVAPTVNPAEAAPAAAAPTETVAATVEV